MPKCSECQIRKSFMEAIEKKKTYIAPRAECKRLSVDRETCDDFTPKCLCGKKNVMSTELPMAAWGQKSHLSEKYCQECEKLSKEKQ